MTAEKKEFWALVELFGHQRIAGYLTEETLGGCSFIRVDIPAMEGSAALTKYYGQAAIYGITPVSEEVARLITKRNKPAPISVYIPEIRQLETPGTYPQEKPEEEEEEE